MKRNYGIDSLRMVAMFFVIILHLVGVGGICGNAPLLSANFIISQFFRTATYCAVNVYALISGFVGWNRTPKLSSLLNLWLKVICFCVGITVFTQFRAPELVGWAHLWKALTPVKDGMFWYFSAYVVLFFFIPLLNHAVRHVPPKEAALSMAGIALLVLSLNKSQLYTTFQLGGGYSSLWLMILYLAGGLMGRYELHRKLSKKQWAGVYLLSVLASLLPRLVLLMLKPEYWTPANQNMMVQYISPTIVLSAVALVGLFSQLELPGFGMKLVSKLSPHAFGVYLFHTHSLIFQTDIVGQFARLGTAPLYELLGVLLGAALLIYMVGTALDWGVSTALKLLKIDRLLKKADSLLRIGTPSS